MAKDLIRLSGFEPEIDIPIVYTGLRPGERLYEELQMLNEKKVTTSHKKITILQQSEKNMPWKLFYEKIQELLLASEKLDSNSIQNSLKEILPTYTPASFDANIKSKPITPFFIKGEA